MSAGKIGSAVLVVALIAARVSLRSQMWQNSSKHKSDSWSSLFNWSNEGPIEAPDDAASMGAAALQAKDYERALACYDAAIENDPQKAELYVNRGVAHAAKKDRDKALADFNEALRLEPKNGDAFAAPGACYLERKEDAKAVADLTQAIALDPAKYENYIQRGYAYADMKEVDKGLADATQAIRLEPSNAEGYTARGYAYEKKKDLENAIANYAEAVRLDPKDGHAYNNLAWIFATCADSKFQNPQLALEYALYICKVTEFKEPFYFDTLAAAHARLGEFEEAVRWQKKSLETPDAFDSDSEMQKAKKRLQLYEAKKPFTED